MVDMDAVCAPAMVSAGVVDVVELVEGQVVGIRRHPGGRGVFSLGSPFRSGNLERKKIVIILLQCIYLIAAYRNTVKLVMSCLCIYF